MLAVMLYDGSHSKHLYAIDMLHLFFYTTYIKSHCYVYRDILETTSIRSAVSA